MSYYKLYVIDEDGRSATWSHTKGHRSKPCQVFPDDADSVIVLEHDSLITHMYISKDGVMEIETFENGD